MSHTYEPAGRTCADGPRPGTVALLNVLTRQHPRGRSRGIFNCRPVRGSSAPSTHGEGRSLDWDPGDDCDPEGDAIAEALIAASHDLGVQQIIWCRRIWTVGRGWRGFSGSAGPHLDHLHIEQTRAAASTLTMTAVAAAYGLARPPRKEPDVPNPTDLVSSCAVAAEGGGDCILMLEAQGGVLSEPGKTPLGGFKGSMLSPGMAKHTRSSSGVFLEIVPINGGKTGEYAVVSTRQQIYRFTKAAAAQIERDGGL